MDAKFYIFLVRPLLHGEARRRHVRLTFQYDVMGPSWSQFRDAWEKRLPSLGPSACELLHLGVQTTEEVGDHQAFEAVMAEYMPHAKSVEFHLEPRDEATPPTPRGPEKSTLSPPLLPIVKIAKRQVEIGTLLAVYHLGMQLLMTRLGQITRKQSQMRPGISLHQNQRIPRS
jgi:hypothetical protein